MSLFKFLFLGELDTCSQNFIPKKSKGYWEKHDFAKEEVCWNLYTMAIFDNKKCIWKTLV
jgi:hypothetical protein